MKPTQWTMDMSIEALGWNMHDNIALILTPSPFVATCVGDPTHIYGFLGHAIIPNILCVNVNNVQCSYAHKSNPFTHISTNIFLMMYRLNFKWPSTQWRMIKPLGRK